MYLFIYPQVQACYRERLDEISRSEHYYWNLFVNFDAVLPTSFDFARSCVFLVVTQLKKKEGATIEDDPSSSGETLVINRVLT